jgi:hypothetical protein
LNSSSVLLFYQAGQPLPSVSLFTQNKKELTISRSDVDKMTNKEIFGVFYSCIFAADEFELKNSCKILLIR